jgi:hypothetical protein
MPPVVQVPHRVPTIATRVARPAESPDPVKFSTLLSTAWLPGVTALALLSPTAAQALTVTVNVNGQDYSITTTASTTYNESSALLQSQPWWNNLTLANSIASAVLGQLGTPNSGPGGIQLGPLFAFNANPPAIDALAFIVSFPMSVRSFFRTVSPLSSPSRLRPPPSPALSPSAAPPPPSV